MSLSITTNVSSMGAQRALKSHDRTQEQLIERLSSGSRINSARDDPAGQAIAARISSGQRGMSQALRSINDGTSMLQVAEGAMANVVESLQRLRELAVASGNATYGDKDRATLQTEALEILAHINQVGEQTKFNGETLFSQEGGSIGGDSGGGAATPGAGAGGSTGGSTGGGTPPPVAPPSPQPLPSRPTCGPSCRPARSPSASARGSSAPRTSPSSAARWPP